MVQCKMCNCEHENTIGDQLCDECRQCSKCSKCSVKDKWCDITCVTCDHHINRLESKIAKIHQQINLKYSEIYNLRRDLAALIEIERIEKKNRKVPYPTETTASHAEEQEKDFWDSWHSVDMENY